MTTTIAKTTQKLESQEDILELICECIHEVVDIYPKNSLNVDIETDLTDLLKEDEFEEFIEHLEFSLGFDSGDFFVDIEEDNSMDALHWRKVKNLVEEINAFLNEINDETVDKKTQNLYDQSTQKILDEEEVKVQETFSFKTDSHKKYIQKIIKNYPANSFLANNNLMRAAANLSRGAGELMNIFWEYEYLPSASIENEKNILDCSSKILDSIYRILAEIDIDGMVEEKEIPPVVSVKFNYPKKIDYLNDIDGCAQLLSIISSDIIDDIFSSIKIDEVSIAKKAIKCLAVINTIVSSCCLTLDDVIDSSNKT
jgi:hypothetical protein